MDLEKKIPGLLTLTGTMMPPIVSQEKRTRQFNRHSIIGDDPIVYDVPLDIEDSNAAEQLWEEFRDHSFENKAEKYGAPGITVEPKIKITEGSSLTHLDYFLDMSSFKGEIGLYSGHAFSRVAYGERIWEYNASDMAETIQKRGDVQDKHVVPITENIAALASEGVVTIVANPKDIYGNSNDVRGTPLSKITKHKSEGRKLSTKELEGAIVPHGMGYLLGVDTDESFNLDDIKEQDETMRYDTVLGLIDEEIHEDNFVSSLNVIDDRIYAGTSQGQIIDVLDQKIIGQRKGPEDVAYGSAVNDIVKVGSNIVDVGRYGVFDTESGQAVDPHAKVIAGTTNTEGSSLYTILEDNVAGKESRVAYDHGDNSTIMTMDPRGLPKTFGKTLEYTDDISQFVPKTSYRRE